MFTIAGEIDGRVGAVVWVAGDLELGGTEAAIARVLEVVDAGVVVWATPTGPHYPAGLVDEEAAFVTILSVFDQGTTEILGNPPAVADDVPKGATP